jgi:hypothetical protein
MMRWDDCGLFLEYEATHGCHVAAPILAYGAIAASVLAAGASAYGSIQSGAAQGAAANYQAEINNQNAQIASQNATAATQAGNVQAEQQLMRNAETQGKIRAGIGASGLDVNQGSAADVQNAQGIVGNMDVLTIRNQTARQAYGYETQSTGFSNQAQLNQAQAGFDTTAGTIGGVSSVIGGASSIANQSLLNNRLGVFNTNTPKTGVNN